MYWTQWFTARLYKQSNLYIYYQSTNISVLLLNFVLQVLLTLDMVMYLHCIYFLSLKLQKYWEHRTSWLPLDHCLYLWVLVLMSCCFEAYLIRRFKWAFLVRPSVNFFYFSNTTGPNLTKEATKHPCRKGILNCKTKGETLLYRR